MNSTDTIGAGDVDLDRPPAAAGEGGDGEGVVRVRVQTRSRSSAASTCRWLLKMSWPSYPIALPGNPTITGPRDMSRAAHPRSELRISGLLRPLITPQCQNSAKTVRTHSSASLFGSEPSLASCRP